MPLSTGSGQSYPEGPDAHASGPALAWQTLARLSFLITKEKKVLGLILSYSLAIGLFSLIVPLTVQEMVNTFAFAIQPIMIVTLVGIMATTLIFIGGLKVLQTRAQEVLVQRLYARVAVALTKQLPRFKDEAFSSKYVNYFFEAELMPRAIVAMLVELINVAVGGAVGMTMLIFYHPYFMFFDVMLLAGFVILVMTLSRGGLRMTLKVNELHYQTFHWLQQIAQNLLHFKSTGSTPLLLQKTDQLVHAYVAARKVRSDILHRQYKGAVVWQALGHSGLIGMAGWLLSIGQITLGQFVASEVIVGTLLLNFETVARRLYAVFYLFTSLTELSFLFSLPKDREETDHKVPLPDTQVHGVRVTCRDLTFAYPDAPRVFENFNLEVMPGEKVAVFSNTSTAKTTLARVLAGLYAPSSGVIRYNGVDLRDVDVDSLNACRGLVLDSPLTVFEGTLEDNITLGRETVGYDDVRWALRFVELEEEVDALPLGLKTRVDASGKSLTTSQILKILLARAIVTRPQLLILDGTLYGIPQARRETILRRLCAKEEPWSVIFISNDSTLIAPVDRHLLVT